MKYIVHKSFFEDLEIIIVNYMTVASAVREYACYYVPHALQVYIIATVCAGVDLYT